MSTIQNIDPTRERMSTIAERFPSLRGRDGVRPFDAEALARDAIGRSHGEQLAARFVLAVWNGNAAWPWGTIIRRNAFFDGSVRGGAIDEPAVDIIIDGRRYELAPFDLMEARGTWDGAHVRAFLAWATEDWGFTP